LWQLLISQSNGRLCLAYVLVFAWGNCLILFKELVNSLSPTQLDQTLAVLETAHSICGPWRSAIRSDALYAMINIALTQFADPFLQVFRVFAGALFEGQSIGDAETQGLISLRLLQLYYDLTAQDLPPIFEDSLADFFAPTTGWFPRYLQWTSPDPKLRGEPDDVTPSLISQIKTTVLEIAEVGGTCGCFGDLLTCFNSFLRCGTESCSRILQ
jgi:exportin-2 (importin alpha re-exporter)